MTKYKNDYEEYVDKYCRSRGFCREEAERHLIVQEVKKMYEERENEIEGINCGSNRGTDSNENGDEFDHADVPEDRSC